jgi:uncharacterized membrane protein (DUF4010 family)
MKYFLSRLREPSSWAGIAGLFAFGAQAVAMKDPQAAGAVVASVLAMFLPEKPAEVK